MFLDQLKVCKAFILDPGAGTPASAALIPRLSWEAVTFHLEQPYDKLGREKIQQGKKSGFSGTRVSSAIPAKRREEDREGQHTS